MPGFAAHYIATFLFDYVAKILNDIRLVTNIINISIESTIHSLQNLLHVAVMVYVMFQAITLEDIDLLLSSSTLEAFLPSHLPGFFPSKSP